MAHALVSSRNRLLGALQIVASAVLLTIALATSTMSAARVTPLVHVVHIDGVIGPAMARYVRRALDLATRDRAEALLIEIDTPGGLMKSMDDITKAELSSPVTTVAYVSPTGARAASAGVFVLYAANIAAMAPTTHLGAAHPVGISATGVDKTMMTKITRVSFLRLLLLRLRASRE